MPTANQKHIEENLPITEWDNPYFEVKEPDQMAFSIKDKYVSIQTCTEGYDYSVFDADYRLIDGGVYDNPDISIHAALKDVLEDFGLSEQDKRILVDYEELMEKTEAVEREQLNERIQAEVPEADAEDWRKQAPILMWLWSIRAGSMKILCSMPLMRTVL